MKNLNRKRDLGNIDAAQEKHLAQFFVESQELAPIFSNSCSIVSGTKGSGKTAVRRAYEVDEIYNNKFFAVHSINLDRLSFTVLFNAISTIKSTAKAGEVAIARNIWRHVLAIYALEAYSDRCLSEKRSTKTMPEDIKLAQEVRTYLTSLGLRGKKPTSQLLHFIEILWESVNNLGQSTTRSNAPTLFGLLPEQIDMVHHYPAYPEMHALCERIANRLTLLDMPLLICLDGLDSIVDYSKQSRNCIFAGLIDAIHKHTVPSSGESEISETILVKALLPLELSRSAFDLIYDLDKVSALHEEINWGVDALKELVRKRLGRYTKSKSGQFSDVWHEVMPEKIRVPEHKVDEPSFDFILRNTLFRPRQLILHLQNILDEWDANHSSLRIDPSFITGVVSKTNIDLVKYLLSELRVVYPELEDFLRSWYGAPSLISYVDFRSRVERHFCTKNDNDEGPCKDLEHVLNDLYSYGIFGTSVENLQFSARDYNFESNSGRSGPRAIQFQFCFPNTVQGSSFLPQTTYKYVAFSPMFHEYGRIKPVSEGYIAVGIP